MTAAKQPSYWVWQLTHGQAHAASSTRLFFTWGQRQGIKTQATDYYYMLWRPLPASERAKNSAPPLTQRAAERHRHDEQKMPLFLKTRQSKSGGSAGRTGQFQATGVLHPSWKMAFHMQKGSSVDFGIIWSHQLLTFSASLSPWGI